MNPVFAEVHWQSPPVLLHHFCGRSSLLAIFPCIRRFECQSSPRYLPSIEEKGDVTCVQVGTTIVPPSPVALLVLGITPEPWLCACCFSRYRPTYLVRARPAHCAGRYLIPRARRSRVLKSLVLIRRLRWHKH